VWATYPKPKALGFYIQNILFLSFWVCVLGLFFGFEFFLFGFWGKVFEFSGYYWIFQYFSNFPGNFSGKVNIPSFWRLLPPFLAPPFGGPAAGHSPQRTSLLHCRFGNNNNNTTVVGIQEYERQQQRWWWW
jgi:hypothetical protein